MLVRRPFHLSYVVLEGQIYGMTQPLRRPYHPSPPSITPCQEPSQHRLIFRRDFFIPPCPLIYLCH